jgi:RimJ/RimL family protein N-acetyltransferase
MAHLELAKHTEDYKVIADLAKEIWTEHYTPIIGSEQVEYMLDKFQSKEAIENQIVHSDYNYYIIYDTNALVGYLSIKKEAHALFLSKIYISKSYRGQGFGKIAMNFIELQAKELNCDSIYLTVNKFNTNSIKAYEKIGYKKIEELVIDIGNGYVMDDFKMEKTLIN